MSFTVTARVSARRFVFQHVSILNALDHGMSLVTAGMADVLITDVSGIAWTPAALYQSMFGQNAVSCAPNLSDVSRALAA